jgi:hypothetical protein
MTSSDTQDTSTKAMSKQDPIHPPTELVQPLWDRFRKAPESGASAAIAWTEAVTHAAQWGADQELEACCEWLEQNVGRWEIPLELRDARRPKPPSLKKQALEALDHILSNSSTELGASTIRRALEALPDG